MNQPRGFSIVPDETAQAGMGQLPPPNLAATQHAAIAAQRHAAAQQQAFEQGVGHQMLMLGLGALARRTLAAISNLFVLLTVASVFALCWYHPDPTQMQLVLIGMYAVFVLVVNYFHRRV